LAPLQRAPLLPPRDDQISRFLLEDLGFVADAGQRLGKEGPYPAGAISNQQERAGHPQRQQHDKPELLDEGLAHAAQLARTLLP